jgi:hypothetical protein
MVRILYEHFFDDPEQYKACQAYWDQLIQDLAESLRQAKEWERWIPQNSYDHASLIEGEANPIADARSRKLNRAFRIIQSRVSDDKVQIDRWLATYPQENTDLPKDELFIHLSLSEESAELAKKLLIKWMTPETTPEAMQTFMDSLFDEFDES